VGFTVESIDGSGQWTYIYAHVGKIYTNIPPGASGHEEIEEFDPEFDLALIWKVHEDTHLCILRMDEGALLSIRDTGELVIEQTGSRTIIGQTEACMQTVCDVMCALGQ
jgi:hypothetical protein